MGLLLSFRVSNHCTSHVSDSRDAADEECVVGDGKEGELCVEPGGHSVSPAVAGYSRWCEIGTRNKFKGTRRGYTPIAVPIEIPISVINSTKVLTIATSACGTVACAHTWSNTPIGKEKGGRGEPEKRQSRRRTRSHRASGS